MVKSLSMEGQFCFMLTFAQSDLHSQDFFYMLNGHGYNQSAFRDLDNSRPKRSRALTMQERVRMVIDNPFLSVRLHLAKLKCFQTHLLNGSRLPLQGRVTERATCNESQARGGKMPIVQKPIFFATRQAPLIAAGLHTHEVESVDTKLAWESDRMLRSPEGRAEIVSDLDLIICRTMPGGLSFVYLDYDVDVNGNPDATKRLVSRKGWESNSSLASTLHPTSVVPNEIVFAARKEAEARPPHLLHPAAFLVLMANTTDTYLLEDGSMITGASYLELQDLRFVILGYNMHACRETCWKKDPNARICRFGFPHKLRATSCIEVTPSRTGESLQVKVELKRNHSQINSFIPAIARSLRCNTDAMYAGVVYGILVYALSYSTKSDVPDMKLLSDRILRALKRMTSTNEQATYGDLMLSVANSLMGSREITAPQALMFIMGHHMKYVSKKIVRLDTSQPVFRRRFLVREHVADATDPRGEHVDVLIPDLNVGASTHSTPEHSRLTLEESKSTSRQYKNYSLRPLEVEFDMPILGGTDYSQEKTTKVIKLRDCSFVTFLAHFEEDVGHFDPAAHTRLRNFRIQLLPDEKGRQVYMRQRSKPAVIMFIPVFAISDHNDQSAYSLLVAHVPWQLESDLLQGYDSPTNALQGQIGLLPEEIRRHFDHRRRFEAVLEETISYASNFESSAQRSQGDSIFQTSFHEDAERGDGNVDENDHDEYDASLSFVDVANVLNPDNRYFAHDPLNLSTNDSESHQQAEPMPEVKMMMHANVKKAVHKFTSDLNKKFLEARTQSRTSRAVGDRQDDYIWTSTSSHHRLNLNRAERRTISEDKVTLSQSKKQTAAYIFIEHQLKQNAATASGSGIHHDQINLLILGGAGSGKSVLLNAITRLFKIYLKNASSATTDGAGTVLVVAPTGISAVNIHGETIDTYTAGYYKSTPGRRKKRADELLGDVKAIVLDEISLTSLANFHALDMMMRLAKDDNETPFGGVHVVLGGDFR